MIKENGQWLLNDIKELASLRGVMAEVVAKSDRASVFIKPICGSSGGGAQKIIGKNPEWAMEITEQLHKKIVSGAFLFQEEVKQHRELAKLNSTSLNTIRIDVFKENDGSTDLISAFLRMGLSGNYIDNVAAGGIFVGINMADGRFRGPALNKLKKGGIAYLAHPDSGVIFKDFEIPYFPEVKRLALEASEYLPPALIGWDIAVSQDGPVLVEGNAVYYDMQLSDIAFGGYRRNPIFQKLKKYLK